MPASFAIIPTGDRAISRTVIALSTCQIRTSFSWYCASFFVSNVHMFSFFLLFLLIHPLYNWFYNKWCDTVMFSIALFQTDIKALLLGCCRYYQFFTRLLSIFCFLPDYGQDFSFYPIAVKIKRGKREHE